MRRQEGNGSQKCGSGSEGEAAEDKVGLPIAGGWARSSKANEERDGTRILACYPATRTDINSPPPAVRHSSGSHASENESYEAFNSRYQTFFTQVEDVFELQRGLNNCFAYDLVPATEVVEAALRASRKVNDYATAVRILEGVKEKVENKLQYQAYLDELKPVIQELGEWAAADKW